MARPAQASIRRRRTDGDPKCEDEQGFKLKVKKFGVQGAGDDDARIKAIEHVTELIKKELVIKGVKCNAKCADDDGECYVDIEPSIDAQLTTKPVLKFNPAAGKFNEAWVSRMKKDTEFTISCQCAIIA